MQPFPRRVICYLFTFGKRFTWHSWILNLTLHDTRNAHFTGFGHPGMNHIRQQRSGEGQPLHSDNPREGYYGLMTLGCRGVYAAAGQHDWGVCHYVCRQWRLRGFSYGLKLCLLSQHPEEPLQCLTHPIVAAQLECIFHVYLFMEKTVSPEGYNMICHNESVV